LHAAILTAACRVRAEERGEDFVRVLNPINIRGLIGAERDCALYIQSTWTGLAPWDGTPFWEQARATGPLRPTAVWGPVTQSQTDGEYVSGITTYEGTLRMVTCGYSVPTTFLNSVGDALVAAIERP
jgi:hypothetical protein